MNDGLQVKFLGFLDLVTTLVLFAHLETFLGLFLVVVAGNWAGLFELGFVTFGLGTLLKGVYHFLFCMYEFL